MRNENQRNESEFFKEYKGIRGMSLTGDSSAKGRFAYLENMYIDHEGVGDCIESIPGFRKILTAENSLHSLSIQQTDGKRFIVFHAGNKLYRKGYDSEKCDMIAEIADCDSSLFSFGSLVIINDTKRLCALDGEGRFRLICEENFIVGCRSITLFDGRLFLSGNKDFPGKIFYSSRLLDGDFVFLEDNHLCVNGNVSYITSHKGRLWVFRSNESEISEITCHSSCDGYPVCLTLGVLNPLTSPISTTDEILILTSRGLMAIENPEEDKARVAYHSSEIDPMLLKEDLGSARLLTWKGYILIACDEHIYLADKTDRGYDWYYLSHIGGHRDDSRVYRYAKACEYGYDLHKTPDKVARGSIISLKTQEGKTIYYSDEGGKRYAVYPTEERIGGLFIPAENYTCGGDLLAFSAESSIYLFNNDMRGVPPEEIKNEQGFDEKEYKSRYSNIIHPLFYSFDHHAPRYLIATLYDDCGLPMTRKSSVGQSLTLKLTAEKACNINLKINTDGENPTFQTVRLIPKEKDGAFYEYPRYISNTSECNHGWIEKQIVIEGSDFASPIGLSSLAFRYIVQEKLKKG